MELKQYKYMFEAEDAHWWYVGNHEIFLSLLERHTVLKDSIRLLDAGCGTAKWLELLKKSNHIQETGVDFQQVAIEYAHTRGKFNLIQGDINNKIFDNSSFELISCFDVICNRQINDGLVIKNFYDYLSPNGHLLITVPAFQFLYSKHDKVVHTGRRYTKKQIKKLLEANGFKIIRLSYVVSLLFPFAFIKRIADKISSDDKEHNEVKIPSKPINKLFLSIMRIEKKLLRYVNLPFGLSVMALAVKTDNLNDNTIVP